MKTAGGYRIAFSIASLEPVGELNSTVSTARSVISDWSSPRIRLTREHGLQPSLVTRRTLTVVVLDAHAFLDIGQELAVVNVH